MSPEQPGRSSELESVVQVSQSARPDGLTVACYTFPHYHPSAVNDRLYGPGWTEYVLMRGARPWYPGHDQPRQPLLGELDERDPATWEKYCELAANHGVDVLIWDSYWYDGEPAFHEALEEGFLRTRNKELVQFAVMWTNHDWTRVYPNVHTDGSDSWAHAFDSPDARREDIWRSMTYLVARYLHHPRYWRLGGKPVLCIWDATPLHRTLGIEGTKTLLDELRAFALKLGHDGIHFHVCFERAIFGDLEAMGFDSYGFYQPLVYGAANRPDSEPVPHYDDVVSEVVRDVWPDADARSGLPYFPTVATGWDTSPRFVARPQGDAGGRSEWPGITYWGDPMMVAGDTPGAFKTLVEAAVGFLNERQSAPAVLTISSWNEWTEGHYLLPDTRFGYGMLEALREALTGERSGSPKDWR